MVQSYSLDWTSALNTRLIKHIFFIIRQCRMFGGIFGFGKVYSSEYSDSAKITIRHTPILKSFSPVNFISFQKPGCRLCLCKSLNILYYWLDILFSNKNSLFGLPQREHSVVWFKYAYYNRSPLWKDLVAI